MITGKSIGGFQYLHISAIDWETIGQKVADICGDLTIPFNVLKFKKGKKLYSLVYSPDFDTANEPIILASLNVEPGSKVRWYRPPYFIYHHKWMMVHDFYEGFNVHKSKARSIAWTAKIKKGEYARIGRQDFWFEYLKKWGMRA